MLLCPDVWQRFLSAQKWKTTHLPTIEDETVKFLEAAEMAKLTALVRGRTTSFVTHRKPYISYLQGREMLDDMED